MVGRISHRNVMLLVDGGSTHNFVQECLVKSLNLQAESTPTLRVMVGNRNEVECCFLCRDVNLLVQGHTFTVDLHSFVRRRHCAWRSVAQSTQTSVD